MRRIWSFYVDPSQAIAEKITDRLAGEGDGAQPGAVPASDSALDRERYLQREADHPDEQADGDAAVGGVDAVTKNLLEAGGKIGIPKEVTNGQIEDVGRIAFAYDAHKPTFLLGSAHN
jgi:hypothetical protein